MKIALAADLHFGSVPEGLAEELRAVIDAEKPDVVVIAGDLTLRARRREFEQARVWLSTFEAPTLVLPGNHDLPYFNLVQRFRNPFHRYKRAAGGADLMPVIECPDGMVLGFNTTRPWQPHLRWQEGTARLRDIEAAWAALSSTPAERFKAVAAHHPLMKVPGFPRAEPVRRANPALSAFAGVRRRSHHVGPHPSKLRHRNRGRRPADGGGWSAHCLIQPDARRGERLLDDRIG